MSQERQYQEGDRVVCVDDTRSFGRLYKGAEYRVSMAFDNRPAVISAGVYHCMERFELIEEAHS